MIRERNKFFIEWKSSTFLLEIMTLLSPANNSYSDIEFILGGRSFIYIMSNRGTKIEPWGTPCFNAPQSEKNIYLK